ncbi:MAG: winged helix-turn-helix domain-containing protein [Acidobacteria bacterium]|nr:winged helix-turn-helix domain-containing protein [Acidobacteriota bacterium]
MEARIYEFEDFRLDAKRRSIVSRASGELIPLSPKAVELLICLIESTGRILTKDELLERFGKMRSSRANLSQTVFVLRKHSATKPNGRVSS